MLQKVFYIKSVNYTITFDMPFKSKFTNLPRNWLLSAWHNACSTFTIENFSETA